MGLVYGLGFPPFRGGALRYADAVGLERLCRGRGAAPGPGPALRAHRPDAARWPRPDRTFYEEK